MKALIASELRYRRLFEAAQDGILMLDARTGMIEDVNPYLIKMLGYSREEFIKKKLWEVGAFKDIEASKEAFEALQEKEYIRYEDLPLKTKDGRLIQVEFVSNVYLVGDEKVIQCNIREITEHQRIIVALQENEKKYHDLINQSPDGYFIIELSGNILTVNKAMCKELEFSEEEFLSMSIWDIIPEQYLDQYRERLTKILAGQSLKEAAEYAVRGKDGKMHYVEVLSAPHYSGKDIIGFQGIARDITARKRAEEELTIANKELLFQNEEKDKRAAELAIANKELAFQNEEKDKRAAELVIANAHLENLTSERKQAEELLRESEDKFKYIFDYSIVGKSITLPSGEMNANKALCDMFGYTQAEFQNKKWQEITHPDDIELTQREIDPLLSGKRDSTRFSKRYIHKAGSVVWVDLSSSIRRDKDGKPLYLMTSVIDITERKRADDALRESERKLREAQEMAHLGFWFWDVKTGDVEWSEEVFKIFGLDPKEFTPQIDSILALSPWPEDHQRDQELINRAIETHRPGNYEQKFLRPDQSIGHYYSTFQGVYDQNGDLISIVGTVLDITERKRTENTLRESEERFRSAILGAPFPIMIHAEDGEVVTINTPWTKLTGYDQSDIPTIADWTQKAYGTRMDVVRADIDQLYALDGPKAEGEYTIMTGSGKPRTWDFSSAPIGRLPDGRRLVISMAMDVTERKQAEETIRSLARFPSENPNPVLRIDRNGKLLYANEATSALLTDWDFQVDQPAPGVLQNVIGEVFETQKAKTVELPCGERVFLFSIAPAPGDEYVNLYARDMTTLFLAQDEIRLLNVDLEQRVIQRTAQLEAANKELEAFSYSVSHDLRAPLRGIDGWSLALLEDYGSLLDEQGKTYLNRVRFETQHMGHLIDDLLQLSRLTRVEMRKEQVNLNSMAQRIAARLQESEPQRQVKFKIQKGMSARGDAHLLEIALTNLLGNAFKFTAKTPRARIEFGQTEIEGQRAFFVRDNGAGFDMAFAKKLFGVFQRLHNASEFPGTGVGLATVQRILHRHGGRIWAEAAINQGATFYFTLEESL